MRARVRVLGMRDGMIFVSDVADAVRIRDGARGETALAPVSRGAFHVARKA